VEGLVRIVDQLTNGMTASRASVAPSHKGVSFQVPPQDTGVRQPAVSAHKQGIDSLQGLMALQELNVPATFRRQKAAGRGFRLLDALGGLRVGLLDGKLDELALANLRQGLDEAKENHNDLDLERILNSIETRAAVELAKLGR